jgi:urease subunit beta
MPANPPKQAANAAATQPSAPVGGYVLAQGDIIFNEDRPSITLKVRNTGDRPIQVGSHFHFFEANRALEFDRAATFGMHLDISSSTAIRFEPGDERSVALVPFGGKRRIYGFNNLVDARIGPDPRAKAAALRRARELGFKSE